jgi:hypothetical protein
MKLVQNKYQKSSMNDVTIFGEGVKDLMTSYLVIFVNTFDHKDSQQGCSEEVSRVSQNINFSSFNLVYQLGCLELYFFDRVRMLPNYFKSYRLPRTKRRLRTTVLPSYKQN